MVDSSEKISKIPKLAKESPEISRKIRNIFELEDEAISNATENQKSNKNKIQVSYNQTIFFCPSGQNDTTQITHKNSAELSKYLINMSSTANEESIKKRDGSSFKLNVKINNNSNYSNIENIHSDRTTRDSIVKERKSVNTDKLVILYIPCMNCGNDIHVDDIDEHAMSCIKMVEEVIRAETTPYNSYIIDYRLKKLLEHVTFLKETGESSANNSMQRELLQEMLYITTILSKDISESLAIEAIHQKSILELKKHLTNLDTLSHTCKSSMGSLIIIDRARVLVNEKLKIFKNEYFLQKENTKVSFERKSGSLILSEKLREKTQNLIKLEQERELERIKVNNLKNNRNSIHSEKGLDLTEEVIRENDSMGGNLMDPNRIACKRNIVGDIESDIDSKSVNSEISDCTSMTSTNSIKEQIGEQNTSNNAGPWSNELKDFVKMVLKVKFEILHNSHKGQQISARALYDEMIKAKVPKSKWKEFIVAEVNKINKYALSGKRKTPKKMQLTKRAFLKTSMEVIDEESTNTLVTKEK